MARHAHFKAACKFQQYTDIRSNRYGAHGASIDVVGEMKASGIKNWFLIVNPDDEYLAAHPEQCWATFLNCSLEQSIEAFKSCQVHTGAKGRGKSQDAIFEQTSGIWKHDRPFGNKAGGAKLYWASVRQPPHSCPENDIRSGARREIHRCGSTDSHPPPTRQCLAAKTRAALTTTLTARARARARARAGDDEGEGEGEGNSEGPSGLCRRSEVAPSDERLLCRSLRDLDLASFRCATVPHSPLSIAYTRTHPTWNLRHCPARSNAMPMAGIGDLEGTV